MPKYSFPAATSTPPILGTAADDRADNTVMGWLNTPIKSVQRGVSTMTGEASSLTVAISATTLAKAVLLMNYMVLNNDVGLIPAGKLNSTTQLVFSRNVTNTDTTIAWQVIEFY